MKHFLNMIFPDIEVVPIHSDSNLFRYDENIVFVKSQLQPYIDNIRNDLAKKNAAKWRDHLRVSLSFADGSSARVSAINASLRHYRYVFLSWYKTLIYYDIYCKIDQATCISGN